jgi:pyridoxal phosphate enzyme (YggS family)
MRYGDLPARLLEVRQRIAEHQARGGWTHPVRIVAVTKQHGIDAIEAARAAGVPDIGENRVQEALAKQAELGTDGGLRWHLIGSLQRNKARQAVGRFELIHAVDRPELVVELARRMPAGGRQGVLVEVNAGESQKGGVAPEGAVALVESVVREPALEFAGLMTMAPLTDDETVQRAAFGGLRKLKERIEAAGFPVRELSMGMSGDFGVAVEEGATMVRLGTILFGERSR